jgi:hypothetical protein
LFKINDDRAYKKTISWKNVKRTYRSFHLELIVNEGPHLREDINHPNKVLVGSKNVTRGHPQQYMSYHQYTRIYMETANVFSGVEA